MTLSNSALSRPPALAQRRGWDTLLAWYFVTIWGSGFLATKTGLQYAAPFTFLSLRFMFGLALLVPLVLWRPPVWPSRGRELWHVIVAGLLVHALHLGGSHYAQFLGMSAGVAALILALQPVITAVIATRWLGETPARRQWLGLALGLAGVALVVWHKFDLRELDTGSLVAIVIGLVALTAGTLYQRHFCPTVDLHAAAVIQFAVTLAVLAPLGVTVEDFVVQWTWPLLGSIAFLVIGASILAVSALHTLMRHGEATRVASILYLTPILAVVLEYLMFDVAPSALTLTGIAIACVGVALTTWRRAPRVGTPD
ncbi:MAG: DMT family transporter [Burkholderiales bacterium]